MTYALPSKLLARELFPWQMTCFCLPWKEDASQVWTGNSMPPSFHHHHFILGRSTTYYCCSVKYFYWSNHRTESLYLKHAKRADLLWDSNSGRWKWIRCTEIERVESKGWKLIKALQLQFYTAGVASSLREQKTTPKPNHVAIGQGYWANRVLTQGYT